MLTLALYALPFPVQRGIDRATRAAVIVAVGAGIGWAAWARTDFVVIALALPLAVNYLRARGEVYLLLASYFGVASASLPAVIARFFADPSWLVYASPWLIPVLLALPFLLVAPRAEPWRRSVGFTAALVLLTVPPLGLIAWCNPLFAAGVLYPGMGYWGLAATVVFAAALAGLTGYHGKRGKLAVLGVAFACLGFCVASIYGPRAHADWRYGPAVNWVGVNTHLGNPVTPGARHRAASVVVKRITQASDLPWARAIIAPESVLAPYTPATEMMLLDVSNRARRRGQAIVVGATIRGPHGTWADALIGAGTLAGAGGFPHVIAQPRVPMPVGNWHLDLWPGGDHAHPFATDAGAINGLPVAWSICYEDTILWPHRTLLTHRAKVMIAVNNDWSLTGTRAAQIQMQSMHLLSQMAGVPLVSATNR